MILGTRAPNWICPPTTASSQPITLINVTCPQPSSTSGRRWRFEGDLAALDPADVRKQNRLAFALNQTANLLIETHDYRAAVANLDESRRIIERLGISDVDRMGVYAFTLFVTGKANRAIGNEQAACEQYSKSRDLYRKLGYSQSNSGRDTVEGLEKLLATCAR